jgi:transposase
MSPQPNPSRTDESSLHEGEVAARVTRRRFSAAQRAKLLEEYDKGSSIERAAMWRRERIYSSHISSYRKQRDAGKSLDAKRGRKRDPVGVDNTRLRKENGLGRAPEESEARN